MEKTRALKEIKELLDNYKIVKVKSNGNSIVLWVNPFREQFINWRCYGQSAVRNNLKELKWLLDKIMENNGEITYNVVDSTYA